MGTQTIIIGYARDEKPKNFIKFEHVLELTTGDVMIIKKCEAQLKPREFQFIELITKDYFPGKDLMFAYDNPADRVGGILFIGQWGDGIVEEE